MGWVVRILMSIAAAITGWFVARDAPNFSVIQMVVALLLIAFFVSFAAFWPALQGWFRNRREPESE